jgi:hypothetical protein
MEARRREKVKRSIERRDDFDFNQQTRIDERGNADHCARRIGAVAKMAQPDRAYARRFIRIKIDHIGDDLEDTREIGARRCKARLDIAVDLLGLRGEIAFADDLAVGAERNLARQMNLPPRRRDNDMGIAGRL